MMSLSLMRRVEVMPSGLKMRSLQEFSVVLACDLVNDDAEQNVVCVAIGPLVAGSPLDGERFDFRSEFIFGEVEAEVESALGADAIAGFIFREAGGVREQILDEDGLPGGGSVGEVLGDAVVERDFSFFHEHHDGGRDELLSDGTGLEEGLRLDGNIELDVGEAVALGKQDLAA